MTTNIVMASDSEIIEAAHQSPQWNALQGSALVFPRMTELLSPILHRQHCFAGFYYKCKYCKRQAGNNACKTCDPCTRKNGCDCCTLRKNTFSYPNSQTAAKEHTVILPKKRSRVYSY